LLGQYRDGACTAFDYRRYWSRSLAMAIAASAICLRVRCAPTDEAFTCGLLSGVGTLALATIYPTEYSELLSQPKSSAQEMAPLERERFATDHNELGAALLEDWHLPPLFVQAVFHHEAPDQGRLPEGSRRVCHLAMLRPASEWRSFVWRASDRKLLVPDLLQAAAKVGMDYQALSTLTDDDRARCSGASGARY
jgi:hypothetical protein